MVRGKVENVDSAIKTDLVLPEEKYNHLPTFEINFSALRFSTLVIHWKSII